MGVATLPFSFLPSGAFYFINRPPGPNILTASVSRYISCRIYCFSLYLNFSFIIEFQFYRIALFYQDCPFALAKYLVYLHSGSKCLVRVACLWSKMTMFKRAGLKEGGLPLPPAFQYLILLIWRACNLNLVIISSLASKCQDFKFRGLQFHIIKWLKNRHSNFKDLQF